MGTRFTNHLVWSATGNFTEVILKDRLATCMDAKTWLSEQYAYCSLLMSIIVNGITFFEAHYMLNGGFELSKTPTSENTTFYRPEQH